MALTKIPNNLIAADAITGTLIADDAINSEHIADGAIDAAHMSANSIDSDSYVDGSIDRAHISDDAINSEHIANEVVNSYHYVPGSIDTAHIGDDQVTADKLANAINTSISEKAPIASPTFTGTPAINHGSTPYLDLEVSGTMKGRFYADASQAIIEAVGNSLILKSSSTTALTLDSSQNATFAAKVGIGESTPLGFLHVKNGDSGQGSVNAAGNSLVLESNGGAGITFLTGSSSNASIIFGDSESNYQGVIIYDHSVNAMKFQTAGGERIRIDTNGKVLIGHTSAGTNGKLQVTGGIGLKGNSEIRNSTNSDDGTTLKVFGNQFVAGSNSHTYSYSEGGYIASLATAGSAILLDVGNTTANTGHRFRVTNAGNGVDGSLQYIDGTTTRFHVDSSTGIIKENDIPVRSRAIAMAMVFG